MKNISTICLSLLCGLPGGLCADSATNAVSARSSAIFAAFGHYSSETVYVSADIAHNYQGFAYLTVNGYKATPWQVFTCEGLGDGWWQYLKVTPNEASLDVPASEVAAMQCWQYNWQGPLPIAGGFTVNCNPDGHVIRSFAGQFTESIDGTSDRSKVQQTSKTASCVLSMNGNLMQSDSSNPAWYGYGHRLDQPVPEP